jgi:ABC-2 type transport system permease protein
VGIGAVAFGVKITNPLATVGFVAFGAVMFISLGYLLASLARTQESANGITSAVQLPMLFLSGIFFPLSNFPDFLKPIVSALPLTYLADALRQVMIGSNPDFPLTTDILVLGAWILVCGFLSTRLFKWE